MLNILVIVAILLLFALYDILLPASRFLAPRYSFETTERFTRKAVSHIFGLMRAYCGVRLEFENVSGHELPGRFLLISNHQSLMDIPVCMTLFPERMLRFVAKWELREGIPFISLILRSQGHALIRRKGDATQAMRSIQRYARRCEREGTCPVIFPEGTRSPDGEVGAFHTAGIRKILDETPLPLVVAVLEGGWRIARIKDVVRNLYNASFRVRVLSVTDTLSGKRAVLEAISAAREEISAELAKIREEEPIN
jgi:1-acyl-sn-glycerol-3-phosphate acyltransferase